MVARFAVIYLVLILSLGPAYGQLMAHCEAVQTGVDFAYTIFSDEPLSSTYYLSMFSLDVGAPVTVTGSPGGWDYVTDGATYVSWFSTDAELPYPHDVPPGASLSGFRLTSASAAADLLPATLLSWDHEADESGPIAPLDVLSPTAEAAIPDSPTSLLACIAAVVGSLGFVRRSKNVRAA